MNTSRRSEPVSISRAFRTNCHRFVRPRLLHATTFEFAADALATAQNAVGGGGRYDGLVEDLGGPATPGIGFALGVDRILACDAEGVFTTPESAVKVFVVDGGSHALGCTTSERRIGADRSYGGRSMKAQMKVADRSVLRSPPSSVRTRSPTAR